MKPHWPSQSELLERLEYDPTTGVFTWKQIKSNRYRGKIAGYRSARYVSLLWKGRKLQAHQVAWCFVNGSYADNLIDHKDGNPFNNAIDNLREASDSQNSQNRRISKRNRSGFKGVSFHAHSSCKNKWRAAIKVNGAIIQLGHFATPQEGHTAYCVAAEKYFGDYARFA